MSDSDNYKIEWTGPYLSDYFPGAGTSLTPWNSVATGVGSTVEEAYGDALEFIYQGEDPPAEDYFPEFADSGLPELSVEDEEFGLDEDTESVFFVIVYYAPKVTP